MKKETLSKDRLKYMGKAKWNHGSEVYGVERDMTRWKKEGFTSGNGRR